MVGNLQGPHRARRGDLCRSPQRTLRASHGWSFADRLLTETYRTGKGDNSTGRRYVWHSAGQFAKNVLRRNGLSSRAASRIWECWSSYPHRCLALIESALNGELADPKLNTLILNYTDSEPVKITVEANDAGELDRRATLPCECGGTLFDWGAGFSDDVTFVNWHCNHCSRVFTEYVTADRFSAIRSPRVPLAVKNLVGSQARPPTQNVANA